MVPGSWKGKTIRIKQMTQGEDEEAGEARLEEITNNGIAVTWQDEDSAERRVFFPWHNIEALELTDLRGPAEPNIRRLGI
jgi:ribosome maturation factor RimP